MFKRNIPNAITCGNLLCGCLAIVKCFEGDLVWAAYLVGIAAVLDFFDGFAARLLKVSSAIGKDLDSLADMVTFGVVPGVMMYSLIGHSTGVVDWPNDIGGKTVPEDLMYLHYVGFIVTIFSAIRLAKFNNDTRQSESFIGLPTPANAIFICSIPLILPSSEPGVMSGCFGYPFPIDLLITPWFLCILSLVMSFLLVAPLPLFALKFKNFKWKGNEIRYTFLLLSVLLLSFLQFIGIPLVIISYLLFSLINNILKKKVA